MYVKGNVKGKGYPMICLYAGTEGRRRYCAKPIRNLGARTGWWSAPRSGSFTSIKEPVPTVQDTGWASEPATSHHPGPHSRCTEFERQFVYLILS